jgi:hypothetical protein
MSAKHNNIVSFSMNLFMPKNYNSFPTNNHNKRLKVIAIAAIALSFTACTNIPNPRQLKTNSEPLKVAIPTNQINPKNLLKDYEAIKLCAINPNLKEKIILR